MVRSYKGKNISEHQLKKNTDEQGNKKEKEFYYVTKAQRQIIGNQYLTKGLACFGRMEKKKTFFVFSSRLCVFAMII